MGDHLFDEGFVEWPRAVDRSRLVAATHTGAHTAAHPGSHTGSRLVMHPAGHPPHHPGGWFNPKPVAIPIAHESDFVGLYALDGGGKLT
jgi:hypothetical protein